MSSEILAWDTFCWVQKSANINMSPRSEICFSSVNSRHSVKKVDLLKKAEAFKDGKAGTSTIVMKKKPVSWEERYNQLVEYKKDRL